MAAREEKGVKGKVALVEREIITIADRLDCLDLVRKDIEDLKLEIKGLKPFLGREYPEFKAQFPEIMKKVIKKA